MINENLNQNNMMYEKLPISTIIEKSKQINTSQVAIEIIDWLIANVENYIDNHKKAFKLYLVLDFNINSLPETKKLQDLYRAIPEQQSLTKEQMEEFLINKDFNKIKLNKQQEKEISQITECKDALDKLTTDTFFAIQEQKDKLIELFNKMKFYYELKGVSKSKLLIQQLTGAVAITKFDYESFDVPVTIKQKMMNEKGEIVENSEEIAKQYTIPEGFTVWLELAFKPVSLPKNLF